jgi:agmatinase
MTDKKTGPDFRSAWQRRFSGAEDVAIPMLADGVPSFMGLPIIQRPEDLDGIDVAIIGVPYDRPATAGRPADQWDGYRDAPDNVRRGSLRFGGFVPELDIEVFEDLKVVDYGNAEIVDGDDAKSIDNVARKVEDAVAAGCKVVTLGGFSPCASYAPAGAFARRTDGPVGVVSLDAHGDCLDSEPGRGRAPSSATWEARMWDDFANIDPTRHVEIGMRGPRNLRQMVETYRAKGAHWYPAATVRRMGIDALCAEALPKAFAGAARTWMHLDMDVLDIGAAPDWGDEPMGLSVSEVVQVVHEAARRGLDGLSFVYVAPRSDAITAIVCYIIVYYLAGLVLGRPAGASD